MTAHVATLRKFLAVEDCDIPRANGRTQPLAAGRGGYFDPSLVEPLVKDGKLREVAERRNPDGGWTLPWSDQRQPPA